MSHFTTIVRKIAAGTGVAGLVVSGLTGVLAMAAPVSSRAASDSLPLRDSLASPLRSLLGLSGRLRAVSVESGKENQSPIARLVPALASSTPGVRETGLEAPDGEPIHLISLVPLTEKLGPTWRGYRVGYWPGERTNSRARYLLPDGFIEVTPENADLPISTSFRLRDFLTHDQANVWPKVLVLRLPLLDKLELIKQALEQRGRPSALRVMSGFRTPQYNAMGVGPLGGRARDSRHMYGDAADIYVDADGDGRMDDLDHDGRVTVKDAGWLARVAEQVEAEYPAMTGGIGVYRANAAHGPFVHVDVRGTPARW
jgi:peptidase M15-like protein